MTALTTVVSCNSKHQLIASSARDWCLFRGASQHMLCRHTSELHISLTSSDCVKASVQCHFWVHYFLLPPNNLTVLSATKTRAYLYWIVPPDTPFILRFELTYDLVDSPIGRYSVTRGIHGDRRQVALLGLIPCQRYRVFMVSVGTTGTTSNFSNKVEFTTTA
ncbi:uncharacterized protein LOC124269875, partial [Haliotis rubra]|uniref:uncharacterized protein LOC124269875 n=1 Tax=Haliotis rubra TaxID=36100 RepID=UPI001EE5CEAD